MCTERFTFYNIPKAVWLKSSCMAKTSKTRRRMDRYFKNFQKNSFTFNSSRRGAMTTRHRKWEAVRRLSKKLVADEDHARAKVPKETQHVDHEVQLLPRKDVVLYGTIPAMEQRLFSKCKNCDHVFNPIDIQSHKNCSRSLIPHLGLLKKKVQAKNGNSKKVNSNGNTGALAINSIAPGTLCALEGSLDFEFKRPFTPPPMKAAKADTRSASPSMPQLKVSVTKIGLSKSSKSTAATTSTTASTTTTSSNKTDSKVSSSKSATSGVHHSPRSSSGHHSSRSGHSPKAPASSSSGHHTSKSPSGHHSPRSPSSSSSSHHTSKTASSVHYSPRSPSKGGSHHGSSHRSSSGSSSSSSSHHSKSSSSKVTPMDTLPPAASSPSSHHHHSHSRHKKSSSSGSSKRSSNGSTSASSSSSASSSAASKILPKNYDPDTHCGVTEGNKGPCMRPITCSNHRLHLRKQVPGRSKDIHQLMAERKAAKENDLKHPAVPYSYTPPNREAKSTISSNTTYVPVVGQVASTSIDGAGANTFVHIMPRISTHYTRLSTSTSVLAKKPAAAEAKNEPAKALINGCITRAKNLENTQDSVVGTVPIVIMPVSPVSVVSSVQLLKIGNNIITLESPQSASRTTARKQIVLPITTNHTNGIRMYKSHPKPIIVPNFGARKLGGAILLANRLLEDQRNNLLTTIDQELKKLEERRLSGLNHSSSPHSPNILKSKGGVKVNCKRAATEKLTAGFGKRLVSDVNGFIIHTDVSESTDPLQYSGENELSQHESIIRLIDQHGF